MPLVFSSLPFPRLPSLYPLPQVNLFTSCFCIRRYTSSRFDSFTNPFTAIMALMLFPLRSSVNCGLPNVIAFSQYRFPLIKKTWNLHLPIYLSISLSTQ